MKKNIILMVVFGLSALLTTAQAQTTVGTGFTYQGELVDNGVPANGTYDFSLDYYDVQTGGFPHLLPPEFLSVSVVNGLFTLENVDFGDIYQNSDQFWLEVYVRESALGGGGSWTTLTPRQKLNAMPYAVQSEHSQVAATANNLSVSGGANDVLVHNGTGWVSGGNKIRVSTIGVSVGSIGVPPVDGLRVGGDSKFDGDLSQDVNKVGLPKYLAKVSCLENSNSVSGTDLTAGNGNFGVDSTATVGYCYVTFPASIAGKFVMVSAIDNDADSASCDIRVDTTQLACQIVDKVGAYKYGTFNVIVY